MMLILQPHEEWLTSCGKEGLVQLSCEKRFREAAEELFQKAGYVMRIVVGQFHILARVKSFSDLCVCVCTCAQRGRVQGNENFHRLKYWTLTTLPLISLTRHLAPPQKHLMYIT